MGAFSVRVVSFFKKNKIVLIILALLFLIAILSGTIFYLSTRQSPTSIKIASNLKGYEQLKDKVTALGQDKTIVNNGNYGRLVRHLSSLENTTLSDNEIYDIIKNVGYDILFLYSDVHNPKVQKVYYDVETLAKVNVPKLYKKEQFFIYCQDTTCQDTPQPSEILAIIEEIKASSVADYAKQAQIDNLLNVGYVSKNLPEVRVFSYYNVSRIIRNDGEFTNEGINNKIADEVYNYVLKTYPEELKKELGQENSTGSTGNNSKK